MNEDDNNMENASVENINDDIINIQKDRLNEKSTDE